MVVDDLTEAARLVAEGGNVVLVVDATDGPEWRWPQGPGRFAVLVGDPNDPAVREAAAAMEAELWAGRAGPAGQNSTSTR